MREENAQLRGAIVAMTRARVIGAGGKLPWHYREDLQRFKARTYGCAILMGRVTWDSIGRRALPGRRNIVLSRAPLGAVEHYRDVESAINACAGENFWVIGGAQIYRAAMPHLNLLDVTTVPDDIGGDVVRFPKIDDACWRAGEQTELPGGSGLRNVIYRRVRD